MRIVHCFRAPVGGLFRHVRDLAEGQRRAGHQVGVVCDATIGAELEECHLRELAPSLGLGLKRMAMRRTIAPADIAATWRLLGEIRSLAPDILHAHGAKGGGYGRVVGTLLRAKGVHVARVYTPHGGSLHYRAGSANGRIYFAAERLLARMTDAFVFVSQYEADIYAAKVGPPRKPVVVVRNGLWPREFEPVAPAPDARDHVFIGELRELKGPDLLIAALDLIRKRTGKTPSAVIVGSGKSKPRYEAMAVELGLAQAVAFRDPMPARQALALAKVAVMPSRAESMPYIALETIAAGVPLVSTSVGGLPEIYGPDADRLVPPNDPGALADAMAAAVTRRDEAMSVAARLRTRVRDGFTVQAMVAGVDRAYGAAIDR